MNLKQPKNPNYCATVVEIKNLIPLDNCDNVVGTGIFGNQVIISKDMPVGTKGLFFPIETKLSDEFLRLHNLYRKPELNNDQKQKGYFEANGRVRAVKFRGHKSEGIFLPLDGIDEEFIPKGEKLEIGDEFDEISGLEVCCKYVPKRNHSQSVAGKQSHKKPVRISRLVENQFRLHYETIQLKKNMHQIHPDDLISITDKWHGTSFVVGNILVKDYKWYHKILNKLHLDFHKKKYDIIYSSRKCVKNGIINKESNHFYSYDLWKEIADQIGPILPKSFTVYGEAVGYLKTGKMIQAGYHYNAKPETFKTVIYRVTVTNPDGEVVELSWPQLKEFCKNYGLEHVHEFYYGPAWMLYDMPMYSSIKYDDDDDDSLQEWQDYFLEMLLKDTRFNMGDSMCPNNNFEVPAEGVVLRKDFLKESAAFKLKNFKFLEWETKQLDSGEIDCETQESEETENE